MVAYSFQKRFAAPIQQGLKTQTIRANRKRHARPGEVLQLYTGMRTAHCARIIPNPICTMVSPCIISFADGLICRIEVGGVPVRDLDGFARLDGFADCADMSAFWLACHGDDEFHGVPIEWANPVDLVRRVG